MVVQALLPMSLSVSAFGRIRYTSPIILCIDAIIFEQSGQSK